VRRSHLTIENALACSGTEISWEKLSDRFFGVLRQVGQTPRVHRVRPPLGGDSNKKVIEVIETIKISLVWTVSDGGYVEKEEVKPHRRGKDLLRGEAGQVGQLPECTALGRPLGGV
jgi:hypothetical protein